MSELGDLIASGFELMLDQAGTWIIYNGIRRRCIADGIDQFLRLRDAGYEITVSEPSCEMYLSDFQALGLSPNKIARIVVSVSKSDGKEKTVDLMFRGLAETDAADPCVTLHFVVEQPNNRRR